MHQMMRSTDAPVPSVYESVGGEERDEAEYGSNEASSVHVNVVRQVNFIYVYNLHTTCHEGARQPIFYPLGT